MKIPSLKEIEEYAMLYAENKPRPTAIVDGFTECYNKFIKPMQQANGDEQSSSNCNIPLVSHRTLPEGFKVYKCTDCGAINVKRDNGEMSVGFCDECDHPLWN